MRWEDSVIDFSAQPWIIYSSLVISVLFDVGISKIHPICPLLGFPDSAMGDENSLSQKIRSVERSVAFLRQEHLTLLHGLHLEILSLQKRCSGEEHTAVVVSMRTSTVTKSFRNNYYFSIHQCYWEHHQTILWDPTSKQTHSLQPPRDVR